MLRREYIKKVREREKKRSVKKKGVIIYIIDFFPRPFKVSANEDTNTAFHQGKLSVIKWEMIGCPRISHKYKSSRSSVTPVHPTEITCNHCCGGDFLPH